METIHRRWCGAVVVVAVALVSACGGGRASIAPSAGPSATPAAAATSSPSSEPGASATPRRSGDATLDAPSTVVANTQFEVTWTGPANNQDYITIIAAGAAKWTNEPFFYTTSPSPSKLVAPIKAGDYELWYVNGADGDVTARRPITVTALTATLDAPAQIQAGAPFQVAWTGPDGPGDYVTIVTIGAARWTNEVYFYTNTGSPGTLVASIQPGAYEVWYVAGQDPAPQARRPVTVTPLVITLTPPAKVKAGADFSVAWTGPNGPSDYITVVPAGSPAGTYTDYEYTTRGSPVTLTAPAQAGNYEIWYASDRVAGIFARVPIVVE
jgi:Ca-activated chloride channel family protein